MNPETISFSINSSYSKLAAPLSTKVPEQTDWEVSDFHQTMTSGKYNHNCENWYAPSRDIYYSPHETLLDILSVIEQKENKYHEDWYSEHEDSTSLPELDEDQSDGESTSNKSSESIHTDNTLVLSRTSTIKNTQDQRKDLPKYTQDTPVKQISFLKKRIDNPLDFISPLKHVFKKQKLDSAARSLTPTSFFNSFKEIRRLSVSKCFVK